MEDYIVSAVMQLIDQLTAIHPIPDAFAEYLLDEASVGHWPKKRILHMEGHVPQHVWFIVSGSLKNSTFNENRAEYHTTWFWRQGEIVALFRCFFRQQRSFQVIETIEDSVLITYTYDQVMKLFDMFPAESFFLCRILTETYIDRVEEYRDDLMKLTAKQRLQKLMQSHPEVFQKISLKDIATYLFISREELSRLRASK